MKSGFFTRILREKNHTANQEHHQQQFQNQVSINEKYCFVCGGTGKVQCTSPVAEQGKTINADLYCNQLDKLNAIIKQKMPALASRKGIVFHHDNARSHTAMVTHQKLNALGWEVLGHPPYAPVIAPSDYYLFRCMQNYLTGKNSSLLKVFLRQLLAILTPRTRTSTKQEFTGYLKDGNKLYQTTEHI
ncbi:histone-lysine N-methyltransferase SETMAR [Trichonephila clavipes]|nr:histone-lysine N-methyltransferase SETMAR [Trichonephila clavipes]